MKYILMHKEIPVVKLDLDEVTGIFLKVEDVFNGEHLPVGVAIRQGVVDRATLNNWWRKRSIPASRAGLRDALEELHIYTPEVLLHKSYGLSLSDQYWICPEGSGLEWKNINFFDNTFSEDIGNILLGHASSSDGMSFINPDNTSDGWLKKKWTIIDGKRCLLKAGSNIYHQEPYNEVIASAVMKRLDIPYTDYYITILKDEPYSVCEDFITRDTELVTCNHLMESRKQLGNVSNYQHFVNCCKEVGLDAVPFLDRMLTVDFLIANTDRHTNNFGLIRNAETLEYVGFAPIYDSGSSLWFNVVTQQIQPLSPKLTSKPFKTTHYEQIKLVTSFDWLDLKALNGIEDEVDEILSSSEYIDLARRTKLCNAIKERVALLSDIVSKHDLTATQFAAASTDNDIEFDVAYSGDENDNDEDLEP